MKHAFILEIDCDSDTDFSSIAEELKDSVDQHFPLACLSCKPWNAAVSTAPTLNQPKPIQVQAPLPPLNPPNFI